jgi:hypothetical protein
MEEYGNSQVDYDDVDEDELIGVSVSSTGATSYIPRAMLKRIGMKIVKDEETGEWEAVEREGADQVGLRGRGVVCQQGLSWGCCYEGVRQGMCGRIGANVGAEGV